jgi:hypothetical protein
MPTSLPGGNLKLAEGPTVTRVGYGATQLAGPGVWGPRRDREQAIAVLREETVQVVELRDVALHADDVPGGRPGHLPFALTVRRPPD